MAMDPGMDPSAAFASGVREAGLFRLLRRGRTAADEDELADAARELLGMGHPSAKGEKFDKVEAIDKLVGESQRSITDFADRMAQFVGRADKSTVPMTVEYRGLSVETDALVGSGATPTVWNSVLGAARKLACQGGLKTRPLPVLKGVSGTLRPGRITLVLGPPGSGKSVLVQALAGRLRTGPTLRQSGSVRYNGVETTDFVVRRTAGLVGQRDRHIPQMTVGETLEFAYSCYVSDKQREAVVASVRAARREAAAASAAEAGASDAAAAAEVGKVADSLRDAVEVKLKPQIVMRVMGLTRAVDTPVGDALLRGVSGGERKRVTTAEILVGPQKVIYMDEISTGLDSATTYSVCTFLARACRATQTTMTVSLLQPAPEVIALFDDLLLLAEGHIIYHGPVGDAAAHFASLGFVCPPRKDLGSFLIEVSTPVGQLQYATPALLAEKGVPEDRRSAEALSSNPPTTHLVSPEALSNAFWESSPAGREAMASLKASEGTVAKAADVPGLALTPYAERVSLLTRRVFRRHVKLAFQDRAYVITRTVQCALSSLIVGSLYSTIDATAADGRKVFSLGALGIMLLAMMSIPMVTQLFATKFVFFKHRDDNLFPPGSYVRALAALQVPFSTIEAVAFSICVYFVAGLTREAGAFFTFLLIEWSVSNSLAALFRLMAQITPSVVVGNSCASLCVLLMTLTNGFTIVRTAIPDYMIWIYWINPFSWTIRALSVNEMTTARWSEGDNASVYNSVTDTNTTLGVQQLDSFSIYTSRVWIWAGVAYLWGFLFLCTALGTWALTVQHPPAPRPSVAEDDAAGKPEAGALFRAKRQVTLEAERKAGRKKAAGAVAFTPITLVCRDIKYSVPLPSDKKQTLQLLKGISFMARPGRLTCLMGGSGAGKTTLLDVVAGRKTQGEVTGDILVNGHRKDQRTWARVVGYVEQMDIHSPGLNVYESLMFSARLRLEEATVSMEQVRAVVEDALVRVELAALRDTVVGDPSGAGLTLEQRKRLSIAVELVANPSVLFMDEPTSGLDARAAAIVMRAIRNVADSGRTVVVTIHQPSQEIFEAFDDLVLVQRGGRLTYAGPLGVESADLIAYLESQPGVVPMKPGYNPATWMLEVTGASMSTTFKAAEGVDFPEQYAASELRRANDAAAAEAAAAAAAAAPVLSVSGRYACSYRTQLRFLVHKSFMSYWRNPAYNVIRLAMCLFTAVAYGLVFQGEGKLDATTLSATGQPTGAIPFTTVQNIVGLFFSISIFMGMTNCVTVMPVISATRAVFYRERAASMYHAAPFSIAMGLAEVPYLIAQALIMGLVCYWMVELEATFWKWIYFTGTFLLSLAFYVYWGQLLIVATPTPLLAQLLASTFNMLMAYFNGFLVPYPQMPAGWQWLNRINPTTWMIYGLGATQLGDRNDVWVETSCAPVDATCVPDVSTCCYAAGSTNLTVQKLPNVAESYFGFNFDFIAECLIIVAAIVAAMRLAAALLLSKVSFERR